MASSKTVARSARDGAPARPVMDLGANNADGQATVPNAQEAYAMVDYRMKAATIEVLQADAPLRAKLAFYKRRAWNWMTWRVAVLLRLRSR